ncbi:hypothetical protein [Kitasatospora sp. NPDC004289]
MRSMKFLRRNAGIVGATLAIATLGSVTPASAEGSWSSYISYWLYNSESRRWTDNHTDSDTTYVSYSGCSDDNSGWFNAGHPTVVELDRDISFSPDQSYGGRDNYCNTVNWGERTQKGSYYFIHKSNFCLSVSSVSVDY